MTNNTKLVSAHARMATISSSVLKYTGIAILISSLIYMLASFAQADSIMNIWFPVMISGVFMVFVSQLIKWIMKV